LQPPPPPPPPLVPAVPVLPPLPLLPPAFVQPPASGASQGRVKVQKAPTQVAPSPLHLQLSSFVHQPSAPAA
jgi:hypothetical protein